MENLFDDPNKIALFAKIQEELNKLNKDSDDESIDKIISLIPANYLNQKEDLKIIYSIFENYTNYKLPSMIKNCIRLFQRILSPIKTILKDESSFFWHIFNSFFYLKLFMFQEGLISIEQIISCVNFDNSIIGDYFYPEIFEQKPEIFENDTKYKLKISYDSESIQKFKELRQKHFKWLLTSGDFNDPIYLEIEQNPLRLSIKRDDVESFQKILSNSNISINSEIEESIFDKFYICPHKVSLLEYAVKYNANNIFKFLVMQNVDIKKNLVFTSAIQNNNYEMIHFFERKIEKRFKRKLLSSAVASFNDDIIEYALNNYNNDIFEKNEMNIENTQILYDVIYQTFISHNFNFFKSKILPFLRKNTSFVKQNIHNLLILSLNDNSFYFSKEILKHPEIDINRLQKFRNFRSITPLGLAMNIGNITAAEELLKFPDIKINEPVLNELTPLHLACKLNSDIKIVKMICNHPKFNFVSVCNYEIFNLCAANNNFYALEYILSKFPDLEIKMDHNFCFYLCIIDHSYITLKLLVKLVFEKNKNLTHEDLIKSFDENFRNQVNYKVELVDELSRFVYECSK